ncbi:MAG: FISUMP domain-containing protein [Candidatus Falkowbacteria bacterium]
MKNKKAAFTLIELLVVIAIIGILATIAVVALQNARAKARDARRIADVKQMQTALELFFNDKQRYPTAGEFGVGAIYSTSTQGTTTYMAIIPTPPSPADGSCTSTNAYGYYPTSDGASYSISYCVGGPVGTLTSGVHCATPAGIADGIICGSGGGGVAACSASTAGGTTCSYAGENYPTVTIGTQVWMAKNLNVGTMIPGTSNQVSTGNVIEKYCYNNATSSCDTYGGLYQWNEAMQYYAGTFDGSGNPTTIVQGICPTGWHMPSDAELTVLTSYLSGNSQYWCNSNSTYIVKSLAATSTWSSNTGTCFVGNNQTLNNLTGFNGLPAGYRSIDGSSNFQSYLAYFWSSTVSGSGSWFWVLHHDYATVDRDHNDRAYGFSMRCLRN